MVFQSSWREGGLPKCRVRMSKMVSDGNEMNSTRSTSYTCNTLPGTGWGRRMTDRHYRRLALLGAGLLLGLVTVSLPAAEKAELRGIGQYEIPRWFKSSFLDLPEDVAEAARNGKRLMVYFGQDGCPYCAELFNNNFSQAHIVEYTRKHFDAAELN